MEKIRTINSYVAIELEHITREKISLGGVEIELVQVDHQREKKLACSYGIVRAVPETDTDIHNHFVNASNDLKEGDLAYFDRQYASRYGRLTQKAEKDTFNLLYEEDGVTILLVPSRAIIMVKRGDEYIAQNDYIIGNRVKVEKTSKFDISDDYYKDRIECVSSGSNISYTAVTKEIDTSFKIEKGEIAVCQYDVILPISDEYEKHGLYCVRQRQVIGKIKPKS